MTTASPRYISEVSRCAKLIRADLKVLHSGVKFSVRSESYSMGDSIRVEVPMDWTREMIAKLYEDLSKYQRGTFNGMTDSYEYTNKQDHAQTKYLMIQRDY